MSPAAAWALAARWGSLWTPPPWKRSTGWRTKASSAACGSWWNRSPWSISALTEEMIAEIRKVITQPLNESLLITLADHVSFAIQRKAQGIEFKNPLAGSILCYYPAEYQMGRKCLEMIRERCGVELNPDEAAFIAQHAI